MAEVLFKFYVNGRHTLLESINFFSNLYQFTKIYITNFAQSWFWWTFSEYVKIAVLIVLSTSLSRFCPGRTSCWLDYFIIKIKHNKFPWKFCATPFHEKPADTDQTLHHVKDEKDDQMEAVNNWTSSLNKTVNQRLLLVIK